MRYSSWYDIANSGKTSTKVLTFACLLESKAETYAHCLHMRETDKDVQFIHNYYRGFLGLFNTLITGFKHCDLWPTWQHLPIGWHKDTPSLQSKVYVNCTRSDKQ